MFYDFDDLYNICFTQYVLVQSYSPSRLLAAFPLASRGLLDRLAAVLIFQIPLPLRFLAVSDPPIFVFS